MGCLEFSVSRVGSNLEPSATVSLCEASASCDSRIEVSASLICVMQGHFLYLTDVEGYALIDAEGYYLDSADK